MMLVVKDDSAAVGTGELHAVGACISLCRIVYEKHLGCIQVSVDIWFVLLLIVSGEHLCHAPLGM